MNDQIWSWLAGGIGLIGFWLGGKKVWWCWYVNVVNQVAWAAFALITGYYAFLVTAAVYFVVFSRNAYLWTKDHRVEQSRIDELIGYSKKDAKLSMQLYNAKGENILDSFPIEVPRLPQQRARDRDGKFLSEEAGPKINHILRLDARTPICERPDEPDFVTSEFIRDGIDCPACKTTIEQWNSMPLKPLGKVTEDFAVETRCSHVNGCNCHESGRR